MKQTEPPTFPQLLGIRKKKKIVGGGDGAENRRADVLKPTPIPGAGAKLSASAHYQRRHQITMVEHDGGVDDAGPAAAATALKID